MKPFILNALSGLQSAIWHRGASMGNTIVIGLVLLAGLLSAGLVAAQTGGTFDLNWSSADGGGALNLSGGTFDLHGTAGQPDAGTVSGGTFELQGGLWYEPGGGPTAVTLVSFTATTTQSGSVLLEWETATEIDLLGFYLSRAESPDGPQVRLNESPIPGQLPPGSPTGAIYQFWDEPVEPGLAYVYWLEEIDSLGRTTRYGPVLVQVPPDNQHCIFLPLVSE